jgi:hypothetical protein
LLAKWLSKRGVTWQTLTFGKKNVMGGGALPGADIQKPYAPKCGKRKTKIDLFRDFLQKSPISKL